MQYVLISPEYLLLNRNYYNSKQGAGIALTNERKKRQHALRAAQEAKYPSPHEIERCEKALKDAVDGRYITVEDFDKNEPMVERTNLMTGKKFQEKLNTPYYCSPSSETYWSM